LISQTFAKTFVNHGDLPIIILFLANDQPVETLDFRLQPGATLPKRWTRTNGHPVTQIDFNWLLSKNSCRTVTIDLLEDEGANGFDGFHLYDDFKIVQK